MLARNRSLISATCPSVFSLPIISSPSKTSSSTSAKERSKSTRLVATGDIKIYATRGYATIAGGGGRPADNAAKGDRKHQWPVPPKGQPHPTPYQIFSMKTNDPYSKARYYELVKLYHPDLTSSKTHSEASPTGSSHDDLSPKIKMERYRLVVAAHNILSEPTKRSAYDRFGAGWNGRAEFHMPDNYPTGGHHQPGPFSHSWTSPHDDPIWANATWEDWEKFYARRERDQNPDGSTVSGERPGPLYMSNASFVAVVAILALIGSGLNYNRAQDAGTYFVEQRDLVHDRAAKELRKVRQEMAGMRGRDERIQFFIRQREATMGTLAGNDAEALRDERAERLLRDRDVCQSDGVQERED